MIMDEIGKVLWCKDCGELTITDEKNKCPSCGNDMEEIGFVEDEVVKKHIGGSVRHGNCGCGGPRAVKGVDEHGRRRYRTQCYKCIYKQRQLKKDTFCNICGIEPEDSKQLHLDHIDGDRSNNSNKNIQTLCVDCHKYKTNKQQDWKRKDA